MKTYLPLLIMILCCLTGVGCSSGSGEDIPEPTPPAQETDYLNLSATTHSIKAAGGTIDLSFTTNTTWTASSDQNWCTLSLTSGAKDGQKPTLTIAENTDESSRTATVTIKAGKVSKTVTIKQEGKEADQITISQASFHAPTEEGSITLTFATNAEWSASSSESWCTLSATSGKSGNQRITVSFTGNPEKTDRTTKITLRAGKATQEITIIQYRLEYITVSQTLHEVAFEAGELNIKVESNTDYTIHTNSDWISGKGPENGSIKLTFGKNPMKKAREAVIKLTGKYMSTSLIVRQACETTGETNIEDMPNEDWNS